MKCCSWRDFQKQLHCLYLWSSPQPKACYAFVLFYFFFPLLLSRPQPQMHFTEFLPFVFFSYPWGIWNLTGKAKYLISLSIHPLFTGIFHCSSHIAWLWILTQDHNHLVNFLLLSSVANFNLRSSPDQYSYKVLTNKKKYTFLCTENLQVLT